MSRPYPTTQNGVPAIPPTGKSSKPAESAALATSLNTAVFSAGASSVHSGPAITRNTGLNTFEDASSSAGAAKTVSRVETFSARPLGANEPRGRFKGCRAPASFSAEGLRKALPWDRISTWNADQTSWVWRLEKDAATSGSTFRYDSTQTDMLSHGESAQFSRSAERGTGDWTLILEYAPSSACSDYAWTMESPYVDFALLNPSAQLGDVQTVWFGALCETLEEEGQMKRNGESYMLDKNRKRFEWSDCVQFEDVTSDDGEADTLTATLIFEPDGDWYAEASADVGSHQEASQNG